MQDDDREGGDLHAVLGETFGFDRFRPGQEEIARILLAGRPALAVFPTGGGKSLCYQLPALLLDGVTLVISPLIALMKDQVDRLKAAGVAAERIDSSLSSDEIIAAFRRIREGRLKLLYVAPERLANEGFRTSLRAARPVMAAIDEAHCISEWGHNFRPDYLRLARILGDLGIRRVLALTATATPAVAADIRRAFDIRPEDHVQLSFHRPNLELRMTPCSEQEREARLLESVRGVGGGSSIIYVTRQETAEAVATRLTQAGLPARSYHAGLPDEVRVEAQEAFMDGRVPLIVATIAFGMGVDKADIRAVIHYNPPKSLENYAQEIGRAGRDGHPAVCEFLACGDDLTTLENFIYSDTPSPQAIRSLVDQVLGLGDEFDVSAYDLSVANDVRPLVIGTFLAYLELEGLIEATRPFHTELRVRMVRPLESILTGYDARRRKFLEALFAAGTPGRVWLKFDLERTAGAVGAPRSRVDAAFAWLEQAGDIVVQRSGYRQGFRRLREPGRLADVAARLDAQFRRREEQDIERLAEVVRFAEHDGCLTRRLVGYFGEEMKGDCGHCARCLGEPPRPVTRSIPREPTDEEHRRLRALLDKRLAPLRTPRQMTRFLCGLTSPAATAARLSRHDDFGMFGDIPFADVLILTKSLMGG